MEQIGIFERRTLPSNINKMIYYSARLALMFQPSEQNQRNNEQIEQMKIWHKDLIISSQTKNGGLALPSNTKPTKTILLRSSYNCE